MFAITLLALCVPATLAHNWVNSWSRAEQANTIAPALPSSTGQPHAQIIAGQPLQVEWVCGHGSDVYFVLLAAKDAAKMNQHKEPLMNAYIDEAPNGQATAQLGMADRKYHRKASTSLDWDGKDKQPSPYFKSRILPTSGNYIARDQTFEGTFTGAPGGSGKGFFATDKVHQFDYPDTCRASDRKAFYTNAKYPWIIGMHRYKICLHMPNRPDVANIRFPANTPAGDYIIHYRWRGYYDAIDVQIVAGKVATANPYGTKPPAGATEPFGQFKRLDHCQFLNYNLISNCGRVVTTPDACVRQCARLTSKQCDGVNVVPLQNRGSVYEGFKDEINIPFDNANCDRAKVLANYGEDKVTANTMVCYPLLSTGVSDIAAKYHVTNDPDDPAFYSTCYVRKPVVNFDMPPAADVVPPAIWNYNGRCATCNYVARNQKAAMTPIWPISGVSGRLATGRCVNCDATKVAAATAGPNAAATLPATLWKDGAYCDGRNGNWADASFASCAANVACERRVLNAGSQELDVSLRDCAELVKADPGCGQLFSVQKAQTGEGRLQCFCYRPKSFSGGCCYNKNHGDDCLPRTNANWRIYKLN